MKIIGWQEGSECECCGRQDLKRVLIVLNDDGFPVAFGSDCARKSLGMATTPALKGAIKAERDRLMKLQTALNEAERRSAPAQEAARLIEAARAANLPFNERPAAIKTLQAEARRVAEAQFSAADLADLARFRANPSALS